MTTNEHDESIPELTQQSLRVRSEVKAGIGFDGHNHGLRVRSAVKAEHVGS